MKHLLTLFFLSACLHLVSAQNTRPLFANEIGLDLAQWAKSRVGVTLLFKHAVGAPKPTNWQNRNALRLLGGFYREMTSGVNYSVQTGDTLMEVFSSNPVTRRYFLNPGWEYQLTHNRWRFYFGLEAGYGYWTHTEDKDSQTSLLSTGAILNSDNYQSEIKTRRVELGTFAGGQFFFAPHWSAGFELNAVLGLEFSRSKNVSDVYSETTFVLDEHFLRLLYVSWHFGQGGEANAVSR